MAAKRFFDLRCAINHVTQASRAVRLFLDQIDESDQLCCDKQTVGCFSRDPSSAREAICLLPYDFGWRLNVDSFVE